jgi:threonine synthase
MEYNIKCSNCHKPSHNLLDYKCPTCGQPLTIEPTSKFDPEQIQTNNYSAWRYADFFPYVEKTDIITLGEGWTPLVKFTDNTYFKLENLNPTGSFKDRGSTTIISALQRLIKTKNGTITEDSSGNAGASIAAYAARANLKAEIYVPKNVSGPKVIQTRFYGAKITKIPGTRNNVAQKAQKPSKNKYYIGHILHPLFSDGIRSLAYEIAEHFKWQPPENIFIPVSAGTLLLGMLSGLKHLVDSNVIKKFPRVTACQTEQVSPLYHRIKNSPYKAPEKVNSIADALVSTDPPLLNIMVEQLKNAHGDAVIVKENEILEAFKELARKGFFVEPSSAVAYAAYKKQAKGKSVQQIGKTVVVLTGTGLKTPSKVTSRNP